MAINLFSTIIFGARNIDKSMNDNVARTPVAIGQVTNAVKEIAKYDKDVAKTLSSINTTSPILQGLRTGAEFAARNINPLICVAGGVKVLTSDDKEKEMVNQTAALGTMFCAEKSYKALMDFKTVTNVANKVGQTDKLVKALNSNAVKTLKDKVGDKRLQLILNILYGVGFVAASITGYNIGEKIAAKINNSRKLDKANKELETTKQMMNTNQPQGALC